MAVEFSQSETKKNLLRAFAGESMARNRYAFAANEAKKQSMHVLFELFTFTADQEKEHAQIFYKLLSEFDGESIEINGSYPINTCTDLFTLLDEAEKNESEEYCAVYKDFALTAEKEGFSSIALTFNKIAQIELTHAKRFELFKDLLKNGKLFNAENEEIFVCLNCGHVHKGNSVPQKCPVCSHDKGFFIRQELAPFTK